MHKVEGLYIEYIPLNKLLSWPHNPKEHSPEIGNSIEEFGFVEPGLIDERTGCLVAGHGRAGRLLTMMAENKPMPANVKMIDNMWAMPIVRGNYFQSDKALEKYLLTSNLLVTAGGWDLPKLEDMLSRVEPYGKIALPELDKQIAEAVANVEESIEALEEIREEMAELDNYDQAPFDISKVMDLKEEVYFYPKDDPFTNDCISSYDPTYPGFTTGPNEWEIPNLRPDKLVQELPKPLMTWGDHYNTPDDGTSWYLFNYGAVPIKDIPNSRCLFSFFSHDDKINTWWQNPAYRVGQLIKTFKVSKIIVPDMSIWQHYPTALKVMAIYKAHWLGRYFQEAGLDIIPRLEFFDEEAKAFSMAGVPIGAPVLATQFHTAMDNEDIPAHQRNLELAIKLLKPKQLLVYVSEKGKKLVEGTNLNCEVVMLETAKKARKVEKFKETDPDLLELRKRKRKDV